ncbi:MAG: 50S ribosomal protein L10 [Desulfobulbus propionicus]|nr:MAG: 50S ribosomal protein L10 [Desulfobulbus propionicus]
MDRNEKTNVVSALNETFSKAKFAVVTDYRGLKVTELEELRSNLRANNAHFQIAKNTLLRLAVRGTEYEGLTEHFSGTTAITFSFEEPVGPAKALAKFAKDNAHLQIRCAGLEGTILTAEEVVALSKLPSREELLAKLLGTMNAVPTGFVRVLNAIPQKFVYALGAIKDQKDN